MPSDCSPNSARWPGGRWVMIRACSGPVAPHLPRWRHQRRRRVFARGCGDAGDGSAARDRLRSTQRFLKRSGRLAGRAAASRHCGACRHQWGGSGGWRMQQVAVGLCGARRGSVTGRRAPPYQPDTPAALPLARSVGTCDMSDTGRSFRPGVSPPWGS